MTTSNTPAITKIISVSAANTIIGYNKKAKLHEAVIAAVYHANVHGNIKPIKKIHELTLSKELANGQAMLAYCKEYAPVTYDKESKSIVYCPLEANKEMTEDMALALPSLFAKKDSADKTVSPLTKSTEESANKKIAEYTAKVEVTTDLLALRWQLAIEEAKVAAIKAQIKASAPVEATAA